MRIKFLILFVFSIRVGVECESFGAVEVDSMLDRCCLFGWTHAGNSEPCRNFHFNMTQGISSNLHSLCRSNIEFCCEKHRKTLDCQKGKRSALMNETCYDDNESETFQLCCRACEIGQQISKLDGKCKQQISSSADIIRNECCDEEAIVGSKHLPTDPADTLPPLYSNEDDDETDPICDMDGSQEKCECRKGYTLDSDNNCVAEDLRPETLRECGKGFYVGKDEQCVDVDECEEENVCRPSEECFNLRGLYICKCPSGYGHNIDAEECQDIDECETVSPCRITENCKNTQGSYICEEKICDRGYDLNQQTVECEDIDECSRGVSCGRLGRCVNTRGSYECHCPSGYHYRYKECEDINECESENLCEVTDRCINVDGSYKCVPKTCDRGFKLDDYTGICEDVDECLYRPCGRTQTCFNSVGSYRCECSDGHRKDPTHSSFCHDIDECLEQPGICGQRCHNTWGSYRCFCSHGYRLGQDNRTCIDRDECEANGKLLCPGTCRNTEGSYRCGCPDGLKLEGNRHCSDINECKNSNACSGSNEVCVNTHGSYSCMERRCDHGYQYLNEVCHLEDMSLCGDNINKIFRGSCRVPRSYSFVFGFMMANCTIPYNGKTFFMFKNYDKRDIVPQINSVKIRSSGQNVVEADRSYFRLEKLGENFKINLMKKIDGPQEIEIDVWLHVRGSYRTLGHTRGYRVMMAVSKYSLM